MNNTKKFLQDGYNNIGIACDQIIVHNPNIEKDQCVIKLKNDFKLVASKLGITLNQEASSLKIAAASTLVLTAMLLLN